MSWAGDNLPGREALACQATSCSARHTPEAVHEQVGNMDQDHSFWGRPEDLDKVGMPRPAYVINASLPGSDMAGAAAAALASASLVRTPAAWPFRDDTGSWPCLMEPSLLPCMQLDCDRAKPNKTKAHMWQKRGAVYQLLVLLVACIGAALSPQMPTGRRRRALCSYGSMPQPRSQASQKCGLSHGLLAPGPTMPFCLFGNNALLTQEQFLLSNSSLTASACSRSGGSRMPGGPTLPCSTRGSCLTLACATPAASPSRCLRWGLCTPRLPGGTTWPGGLPGCTQPPTSLPTCSVHTPS